MKENSDWKAAPTDDLRASCGEVVRRVDLELATQNPKNVNLGLLAKSALAGDLPALDVFHDLVGLVLSGVAEHVEGDPVRLSEIFQRPVFLASSEGGCRHTAIDAAALVAWLLSPDGRTALARRGITLPAPTLPTGALTSEEAVVAARNVGVDLTCGECAALFYTGHPSSLAGPSVHASSCKSADTAERNCCLLLIQACQEVVVMLTGLGNIVGAPVNQRFDNAARALHSMLQTIAVELGISL